MANVKNQNNALNVEENVSKSEAFFLKYKKAIIIAVIAVIAIIAGFIYYRSMAAEKEAEASTILAKGQEFFAKTDYDHALNGDSVAFKGFLWVAKEYSSTKAGNLANLYIGLCYAQLKKWEQAASFLEKYDNTDDAMIGPAAYGTLGNVYAHLNQLDKAVECLKKAAAKADNYSLSPTFLIQAGEILESQNKLDEALKLYQEVKTKYFQSMQYQEIDKYIERVSK